MTPTDSNPHKFLISQKEDDAGGLRVVEGECSELSGITIACMEILCSRRGNLLPDPEVDCIEFICVNYSMEGREEFAIVYATGDEASFRFGLDNSTEIKFFQTELQMVKAFVEHMIISDPDIIVSFDLSNRASLGYMCERVQKKYNFNVEKSLGRTISVAASFQKFGKFTVNSV
jgi:DNA polymerase elongation subunit (family B)